MAGSIQPSGCVHQALLSVVVCVIALSAAAPAQRTHIVDVGLNGTASFTDRDTGRSTFNINPVPTVIQRGDSVEWRFLYGHSSTSGTCPNSVCTPNGTWDSGIKPGPSDVFPRTFTTTGVFPYFCLVHLSLMQGKVMVLEGPEFILEVNNPSQTAIPAIGVLAGQTATFTGSVSGFLGYNNPVQLSCQNGSPRLPATCSTVTVTPDGNGGAIAFNLTATDPTPGTYTFDIVAVGTDTRQVTKRQQVQLQISDVAISSPVPQTVTAIAFVAASDPMTFNLQSIADFSGFVSLDCTGLPPSSFCFLDSGSPFLSPGSSETISMRVSSGVGPPDIYQARVLATAFFLGSSITHSRPFTLRLLPADHLSVAAPSTVTSGTPFNLTVRALDRNETVINGYNQSVHFTSTDSTAGLPANSPVNNGQRTFPVTLKKLGPRTVTANDLSVFATAGTSPIIFVQPGSPPNTRSAVSSSRAPAKDAYFKNDEVILVATVSANSGTTTPTGVVRFFDGAREISPPAGVGLSQVSLGVARASLALPHLRPGGHMITVIYDGDLNFQSSVSQPFSQPRSPAPRCVNDRCPGSH
jgi:plastocyanin